LSPSTRPYSRKPERGLAVERQVPITFEYSGQCFEGGFRADAILDAMVILEIKSVEILKDVHRKQLLTYLRLSGMRLGFLLNFGAALMKDGIVRIVNGLPDE
jgi:GxxExxY protein